MNQIIREDCYLDSEENGKLYIAEAKQRAYKLAEQMGWIHYTERERFSAPFRQVEIPVGFIGNMPSNIKDAISYAFGYGYKMATYEIILRNSAGMA